jgi:hypothetical protein
VKVSNAKASASSIEPATDQGPNILIIGNPPDIDEVVKLNPLLKHISGDCLTILAEHDLSLYANVIIWADDDFLSLGPDVMWRRHPTLHKYAKELGRFAKSRSLGLIRRLWSREGQAPFTEVEYPVADTIRFPELLHLKSAGVDNRDNMSDLRYLLLCIRVDVILRLHQLITTATVGGTILCLIDPASQSKRNFLSWISGRVSAKPCSAKTLAPGVAEQFSKARHDLLLLRLAKLTLANGHYAFRTKFEFNKIHRSEIAGRGPLKFESPGELPGDGVWKNVITTIPVPQNEGNAFSPDRSRYSGIWKAAETKYSLRGLLCQDRSCAGLTFETRADEALVAGSIICCTAPPRVQQVLEAMTECSLVRSASSVASRTSAEAVGAGNPCEKNLEQSSTGGEVADNTSSKDPVATVNRNIDPDPLIDAKLVLTEKSKSVRGQKFPTRLVLLQGAEAWFGHKTYRTLLCFCIDAKIDHAGINPLKPAIGDTLLGELFYEGDASKNTSKPAQRLNDHEEIKRKLRPRRLIEARARGSVRCRRLSIAPSGIDISKVFSIDAPDIQELLRKFPRLKRDNP